MINRKITILGPEGTNLYILIQFFLFNFISWFTLFIANENIEFNTSNTLSRQIIFSLLGLGVFFFTTYFSIESIYKLINPLLAISILLLLGLRFTNPILGVRRWYDLSNIGIPFFLQPSEFLKIILVLFLAKSLSSNQNLFITLSVSLASLALVFIQPDLGTSILLGSTIFLIFFLSKIKLRTTSVVIISLILLFFIFLELGLLSQYQVNRITDFFSGQDFSQQQSRLSISSGGLFGDYFSINSNYDVFVPVQTTDFIFSLFAKNFGFLGSLILLILWFFFFYRVTLIIKSSDYDFEKFTLSGFIIVLSAQIIINLLTVLGLIPLTGMAFPLLSLGGSSILSTSIIFGLINRVFIENNIVL
ncbi:MAG: FtsW/RodA/SpoVE family cell cycle protein [Actinomycetota bacterium]|nr:FtsW/RodA/SpoVE family cell cycle protein [Actinomycetota bacterium]MDA3013731.1 FtsW/RodA/SpoVE family cell cycle protein [Actinomycetota bacterium]